MRSKSYLNQLCSAKVNLILRIGAKRRDGYHEIESLMVKTRWGDRLSLKIQSAPKTKIHLRCSDLEIAPEKNLVYRAAHKFSKVFGVRCQMDILLQKVTPTGAGLGGGSSDAAKVLELLYRWRFGDRMVRKGARWQRLLSVAAKLGADVPFFLGASAAWCTGFGEILDPVQISKLYLVLVLPNVTVPTPWAYQELDRARSGRERAQYLKGKPAWLACANCRIPELENHFQSIVVAKKRKLSGILKNIAASGADAGIMSGSGSSFFGVYHSRSASLRGARYLRSRGFRVVSTESETASE